MLSFAQHDEATFFGNLLGLALLALADKGGNVVVDRFQ
jgi:hypothetical protein